MIAVATGSAERLSSIRERLKITMPMPIATDEWRESWGVVGFPETVFLDRQGRIVERILGGQEEPYFSERIEALLAEDAQNPVPEDEGKAAAKSDPAASSSSRPAQTTGRHRWYERLIYRMVRWFR